MQQLGAKAFGTSADWPSIRIDVGLTTGRLLTISSLGTKWKSRKQKLIGASARASAELGTRALTHVGLDPKGMAQRRRS